MPSPTPLLFHLLMSLLPSAANAVDLRLYLTTPNCTGAYISCLAHEPEACCGTGPLPPSSSSSSSSSSAAAEIDIVSVMWTSIPAEWSLIFSSYTGGECGKWLDSDVSAGRESVCGAGGAYTGISYEFLSLLDDRDQNRKSRRAGVIGEQWERGSGREGDGAEASNKCKRADVLVLEDGTEHDLGGLDRDAYAQVLLRSAASSDAGVVNLLG